MICLKEIATSELEEEILEFAPVGCLNCGFEDFIPRKFYVLEPRVTDRQGHKKLQKLVRQDLGYDSFKEYTSQVGHVISVSRCPRCGSEKIFEDF